MNVIRFTSTATLALLCAMSMPAWAQEHEQEKKEEPAKQEEKKEKPAKPAAREEKPAARQDEKSAKPEERTAKPEERNAQQHDKQAQPERQAQQSRGRIPDEKFRASFGQQHRFRVREEDYRNGRHFQYGGYSFGFVSEWPSNWLYTQDVYVIEIDGVYYLCNAKYPGVNLELSIVL